MFAILGLLDIIAHAIHHPITDGAVGIRIIGAFLSTRTSQSPKGLEVADIIELKDISASDRSAEGIAFLTKDGQRNQKECGDDQKAS